MIAYDRRRLETTASSVMTAAVADSGPHQPARQADRAERDEHHDADDVGQALRDDDGRGASDRDPVRLEEEHRLEDLADLAWRHRQDEAAEIRVEAVDPWDALDVQAREIKFPLEPARQVAREGQPACRREGPPVELRQLAAELAHAAPHGEASVDDHPQEHGDHDATESGRAAADRRIHRESPLRRERSAARAHVNPPTTAATRTP